MEIDDSTKNSIVPLMSKSHLEQRPSPNTREANVASSSQSAPICFLFLTLFVTLAATFFLSFAVITDHWETSEWDPNLLKHLTNNTGYAIYSHLDGRVFRLTHHRGPIFLVPSHSGIWTSCIDLNEHEFQKLSAYGFPDTDKCISYLTENSVNIQNEYLPEDYQPLARRPTMRIQNLSISCSLVCLIILGSASFLGAFGVCQRQISAILVTGVMYLLAALFALFTLMIVHFKRHEIETDADFYGFMEGIIAEKYFDDRFAKRLLLARFFLKSWSFDLALIGVLLCGITHILWIMLSKIMRY